MKFRTTKNPIFCPMGLRRAMPTALALAATLALVSSGQAQVTGTWTGASVTNNNWFSTTSGAFTSANFSSPSTLVSSTATTDLLFEGTTRPSTVLNRSFSARSLTFNTGTGFSISPLASQTLTIGDGGIDNQVAQQQTFNTRVVLSSGTTPVNVVSGGEVVFEEMSMSDKVLEKIGSGTVTFNNITNFGSSIVRSTAGTTNLTKPNQTYVTNVEVNGGQVNLGPTNRLTGPGLTRVSGGVFSALGGLFSTVPGSIGFEMTSGTMILGDHSDFSRGSKISGGTVVYAGTGGSVVFDNTESTAHLLEIEGGSQDFGAAVLGQDSGPFSGSSLLVTGGTSTGFLSTQGVTNDGGAITFTASDFNAAAFNDVVDLDLTSGTVSINAFGGGAIGALVNSVNTTLGAGNTLNLDFNEDLSRDLLITSGTLNWGGNVALNLTNGGEMPNGSSWNFFNDGVLGNTGAFAGTLDGISLAATDTYNGLSFTKSGSLWTSTATVGGQQFTFNETTGVLAVVPEPSSIAVVGMGLAMLGWRRLARRQRAAA
jgi:hypothetical protein